MLQKIGGCASQCCVVRPHEQIKCAVSDHIRAPVLCDAQAAAAVAAAVTAGTACSLFNTKGRPREDLLPSASLSCGGRGSAPLELSLQREVWSSPPTHPTQQRQPVGDNNNTSHLKMRRQVIK